jgi:hypothetical protein
VRDRGRARCGDRTLETMELHDVAVDPADDEVVVAQLERWRKGVMNRVGSGH